ncbi:MAG: MFS transporter [Chlamydiales bacterium]|nr:MFS transporter [Chlamydiales bacterium]
MEESTEHFKRTRAAVLFTGFLSEPLMQAYLFVPFILRKSLNASVFQIAVLYALKYFLAAFCVYWVSSVYERKDKLKNNIIWAGIFSRLPFFLFPFIDSAWVFVFLAAIYKLFYKAGTPAWLEILKLNLPEKYRSALFAYGAALAYGGGVLLLPFMGSWMDQGSQTWRWIFPAVAALSMFSVYFQAKIPIDVGTRVMNVEKKEAFSWKSAIVKPWKKTWKLLNSHTEFSRFHWGYMLCGSGILISQPIVPVLCVDVLSLKYVNYAIALALFKGLGLTITSPLWGRYFQRIDIFRFTACVFLLMGMFTTFLIFSKGNVIWMYLAHLIYGVALAGDHISWNLSGPAFAKDKDSSVFSTVNVILLGLRACVAPALGSVLHALFGPFVVLAISSCCCFISAFKMFQKQPVQLASY